MHSQVLEVTPELATAWMGKNTYNRLISRHTVRKYASDMERNKWTLNHQGIAFGEDGVLVDGQHRLLAVIEAAKTVRMMVTWGADRTGIDELRVRSTQDVIKFGGMSDWITPKDIQTAKQMAVLFTNGNQKVVISTTELVEFAEKNKAAIRFSGEHFLTNKKAISTALVRASVAVAYYHVSHECLSRFVDVLYTGVVQDPKESAVIRLREHLIQYGLGGGAQARTDMAKKTGRAIVAFSMRKPLASIRTPQHFPFLLPEDKL